MSSQRRNTRAKKVEEGAGRTVKEKFQQEREESVRAKPLVPMNKKQQLLCSQGYLDYASWLLR